MIIVCVCLIIISILLWDYLSRDQRKIELAKQFKGPLAIPILGNFYLYLNKKPEGESINRHECKFFGCSVITKPINVIIDDD